jgi:hypothetical protein
MPHGYADYFYWAQPMAVQGGGTGNSTFTDNGVLIGHGTNAITSTAAGSANQVLRWPAGGGAPAPASLGILADLGSPGSAGLIVLATGAGSCAWGSPDTAGVGSSVSQSIPNNTVTALTYDTAMWDSNGLTNFPTQNTRITIKTAGKYEVTANIEFAAPGATSSMGLRLMVNASTYFAYNDWTWAAGSASRRNIARLWKFSASDYIEVYVFQSSGAALNIDAGTGFQCSLSVCWVAP